MIDKKYRTQKQKLFEDSANRTPHYGIRKFTVGAASVLLSTTLWMGGNAGAVHADTVDGSATTEQVNTADQSADSGTASTANTQASTEEAKAETQVPAASAKQAAENGVSQKAASQTENAETVTDTAASSTETQNSASEKQDAALNSAESQASAVSVASELTNAASTENSSDIQKADNLANNVNNGAASAQAQNELASAAPANDEVQRMVQSNAAAALSKDYEKILQANIDMYVNNAVPSFGSWGNSFLVFFPNPNDENRVGKYFLQDVTPGHKAYTTSASYTVGSASAGGETKSTNTYYFVDDSQNQAIVGGTHQISGGVGNTVPLNLTVPSGYVLSNGQSLPTSYTFAKTNSDIIINLVPIYKSESLTDTGTFNHSGQTLQDKRRQTCTRLKER